jgi:hypothetical protein
MITEHRRAVLTMHGPAIYRIRVRGNLDVKLSDRFAGMQITKVHGADKRPETLLVGRIADQATLTGILNALYEMHLPVVSARCVDTEADTTTSQENDDDAHIH